MCEQASRRRALYFALPASEDPHFKPEAKIKLPVGTGVIETLLVHPSPCLGEAGKASGWGLEGWGRASGGERHPRVWAKGGRRENCVPRDLCMSTGQGGSRKAGQGSGQVSGSGFSLRPRENFRLGGRALGSLIWTAPWLRETGDLDRSKGVARESPRELGEVAM